MWPLGCTLFQVSTGEKLFKNYRESGDCGPPKGTHLLHSIHHSISPLSTTFATTGLRSSQYFSQSGLQKQQIDLPTERLPIDLVLRDKHFASLLRSLLQPEPYLRPTALSLLSHSYFTMPIAPRLHSSQMARISSQRERNCNPRLHAYPLVDNDPPSSTPLPKPSSPSLPKSGSHHRADQASRHPQREDDGLFEDVKDANYPNGLSDLLIKDYSHKKDILWAGLFISNNHPG